MKKNPSPAVLTVSLSHLQQNRLLQHDGENLVLFVLLVIDDLYIQQLPKTAKVKESCVKRWASPLIHIIQEITTAGFFFSFYFCH